MAATVAERASCWISKMSSSTAASLAFSSTLSRTCLGSWPEGVSLSLSYSGSLFKGGRRQPRLDAKPHASRFCQQFCLKNCRAFSTEEFGSEAAPASTSPDGIIVLVIGGGGREHALCAALQRSPCCDGVFCAPGNAGIAQAGDATVVRSLDVSDHSSVVSFCVKQGVGLVVVGPEAPLVSGLVDCLSESGIPAFGPSKKAAALEGSKDFMKKICDKYKIPTAKYGSFTDPTAAKEYIAQQGLPIVVKADGLAAGKGVIIATSLQDAYDAVDSMLVGKVFGDAGGVVVVEEFLDGEEASFFAVVDGETAVPLASAQDHKRVGDGDTGPNTGGMGAYSPAPVLTPQLESKIMESIILPTVKGMAAEGARFVGVLYAGVIVETRTGLPKLLEYNVRFGDPECQVLMMRLQSDLLQLLLKACTGRLDGVELEWAQTPALLVVLASKGYPGSYVKGSVIRNLEEAEQLNEGVKIFHAGTDFDEMDNIISAGGRVLGVAAIGSDIAAAQKKAYQAVDEIWWPDGFCRRDIGWRAVSRLLESTEPQLYMPRIHPSAQV